MASEASGDVLVTIYIPISIDYMNEYEVCHECISYRKEQAIKLAEVELDKERLEFEMYNDMYNDVIRILRFTLDRRSIVNDTIYVRDTKIGVIVATSPKEMLEVLLDAGQSRFYTNDGFKDLTIDDIATYSTVIHL